MENESSVRLRLEEEAADMRNHLEDLAVQLNHSNENTSKQEAIMDISRREMNLKVVLACTPCLTFKSLPHY